MREKVRSRFGPPFERRTHLIMQVREGLEEVPGVRPLPHYPLCLLMVTICSSCGKMPTTTSMQYNLFRVYHCHRL
jgi:hypothetical protein